MNQKKEILEKLAFIRRHKEFASFGVKEQEVSYNPCLSEEDIKEFEHKHCITLPDDYRTFISEIGNGGFIFCITTSGIKKNRYTFIYK